MCSVSSNFSDAKTGIFWDMDACPMPVHLTPALIYNNLKISLGNVGYTGEMSILAYTSSKSLTNAQNFESANIKLLQKENNREKHSDILVDIYDWVMSNSSQLTNILVISQDTPYYVDYSDLEKHGNNILLAFPEVTSGLSSRVPSGVPSFVWVWSSLSNGGSPFNNHLPEVGTSSLCDACNKKQRKQKKATTQSEPSSVETMCSVSTKFSEALTGIFWDLDACPISVKLTPASIYDNFKISLGNMGYTGEMSIFAYSSSKKSQTNAQDFESANIKLLHKENKHAKHHMMRTDISLWGLKHRFCLTNIMVISKVILDDNNLVAALLLLKEHENNVLLALPSKPSELLRLVSTSVWLWSSLRKGRGPNYINQLAIKQQVRSEGSLCRACKTPLLLCGACKKPMKEEAEGRSSKKACRKRKSTEEESNN